MIGAKQLRRSLPGPILRAPHRGQYDLDLGCEWYSPRSTERLPEPPEGH